MIDISNTMLALSEDSATQEEMKRCVQRSMLAFHHPP